MSRIFGALVVAPLAAEIRDDPEVSERDRGVRHHLDLFDLDSAAVKRWDGGQRGRPRSDDGAADDDAR